MDSLLLLNPHWVDSKRTLAKLRGKAVCVSRWCRYSSRISAREVMEGCLKTVDDAECETEEKVCDRRSSKCLLFSQWGWNEFSSWGSCRYRLMCWFNFNHALLYDNVKKWPPGHWINSTAFLLTLPLFLLYDSNKYTQHFHCTGSISTTESWKTEYTYSNVGFNLPAMFSFFSILLSMISQEHPGGISSNVLHTWLELIRIWWTMVRPLFLAITQACIQ